MPTLMTSQMMRQIIMDHYSDPINKHQPPKEGYEKVHMHSDNCIDDLDIFLLVKDGKIIDACFDGVACTISTSSTDIMCELLKDKDINQGKYIIDQFQHMIHEEPFDENALEEAYELVEAINNQDLDNMIEESGDLMLQSIFHCVIGEDMGEYNTEDALSSLCSKLIFRHPHIFGDIVATNKDEALAAWDAAKAKEKKYTKPSSKMDSIAKALPSVEKAKKIISVAKKNKFVTDSVEEAKKDLQEKLSIFANEQTEDNAGKVLMSLILVMKLQDLDPEVALDKALSKFVDKFKEYENMGSLDGITKEEAKERISKINED